MKRSVHVLIEEEIIRLARQRAAAENRPLSKVIQDALIGYLHARTPDPGEREAAYWFFCERPILISKDQLRAVLFEEWERGRTKRTG